MRWVRDDLKTKPNQRQANLPSQVRGKTSLCFLSNLAKTGSYSFWSGRPRTRKKCSMMLSHLADAFCLTSSWTRWRTTMRRFSMGMVAWVSLKMKQLFISNGHVTRLAANASWSIFLHSGSTKDAVNMTSPFNLNSRSLMKKEIGKRDRKVVRYWQSIHATTGQINKWMNPTTYFHNSRAKS